MTKANPAQILADYEKQGYNILTPSVTLKGLSRNWKATIKTVKLSSDPNDGDVYPHRADTDENASSKQFRVTKQGLDKLSVLAGVIWHEGRGVYRSDDGSDPDFVRYEAFGAIRLADGTLSPCKASYALHLDAIEEELEYQYRKKGSKKGKYQKVGQDLEDYVNYCVGRDMRSKRKHRDTLCESGAKNRVIRALLGTKKVYTKAQLSRPFVCVSITYQPDESDPEVKRLLTLAAIGASMNVYGMPGGAPAPTAQLPPPDTEDVITVDGDEDLDDLPPNGAEDEEPVDTDWDIFDEWDRDSKLSYLRSEVLRKRYDLKALLERMGKNDLSELNDVQLLSFRDKLAELPEPEHDEDDIPF